MKRRVFIVFVMLAALAVLALTGCKKQENPNSQETETESGIIGKTVLTRQNIPNTVVYQARISDENPEVYEKREIYKGIDIDEVTAEPLQLLKPDSVLNSYSANKVLFGYDGIFVGAEESTEGVIVTYLDVNKLYIDVPVEYGTVDMLRFCSGMTVFSSVPGRSSGGYDTEIISIGYVMSEDGKLNVRFKAPYGLLPGENVRVELKIGMRENILAIEKDYLYESAGKSGVYILEGEEYKFYQIAVLSEFQVYNNGVYTDYVEISGIDEGTEIYRLSEDKFRDDIEKIFE